LGQPLVNYVGANNYSPLQTLIDFEVFVVNDHCIACLFDNSDAFTDTVVFHFIFKRQRSKGEEYSVTGISGKIKPESFGLADKFRNIFFPGFVLDFDNADRFAIGRGLKKYFADYYGLSQKLLYFCDLMNILLCRYEKFINRKLYAVFVFMLRPDAEIRVACA
jgi:hypothetical protein